MEINKIEEVEVVEVRKEDLEFIRKQGEMLIDRNKDLEAEVKSLNEMIKVSDDITKQYEDEVRQLKKEISTYKERLGKRKNPINLDGLKSKFEQALQVVPKNEVEINV